MKLTVFPSGKGDCLLLEASSGQYVLVDGGTRAAYQAHVARAMGALRQKQHDIALAMVSHTDSDHIAGILQLLDDEVAHRVHDYQRSHGNPRHKAPERPRPPVIKELWHNAFGEQVGVDDAHVASLLERTASILSAASTTRDRAGAADRAQIAESIPEALKVTRRASPAQLGIPINPGFASSLVMTAKQPVIRQVGSLKIRLVGPRKDDVDRYREEWQKWLTANEATLELIRRQALLDERSLRDGEAAGLLGSIIASADMLGDRTKVTTPNLASIMVLVQEAKTRVLLTGDGHGDDLLEGLQEQHLLDANGGIHVEVFKVQHHGSEHNITEAFARAVTADHYVFCGNGEHENPDLRVVKLIAQSRLGGPSDKSPNPEVDRPFTFWFNTSSATTRASAAAHVKALERQVRAIASKSSGRMQVRFGGDTRLRVLP